jgi:hypothetical protein
MQELNKKGHGCDHSGTLGRTLKSRLGLFRHILTLPFGTSESTESVQPERFYLQKAHLLFMDKARIGEHLEIMTPSRERERWKMMDRHWQSPLQELAGSLTFVLVEIGRAKPFEQTPIQTSWPPALFFPPSPVS